MSTEGRKILLGVCGSVAAFKAAALASRLVQSGFEVRVVLSTSAREFVGVATFEGLTGNKVLTSVFEAGEMMAHIHLARWADLTLLYPATANTLTKLATGRGDDLLGALFLAHDFKTPYWVAPAMNPAMFAHPAVKEARAKLENWGVEVLAPGEGRMACGEVGEGRLIEPEAMLERVSEFFGKGERRSDARVSRQRVMVTAGGTSEAIDPVRVLTNTSTGETGIRLAQALAADGHDVCLLVSCGSPRKAMLKASANLIVEEFGSFEDLDRRLQSQLSSRPFDWVIHAAAVSDYGVERVEDLSGRLINADSKIRSGDPLRIVLKPYPKIVNRLRDYSRGVPIRLISFKLTTDGVRAPDLTGYDSDFIVHNDLSGLDRAGTRHEGQIYARQGNELAPVARFLDKEGLVSGICRLIAEENRK